MWFIATSVAFCGAGGHVGHAECGHCGRDRKHEPCTNIQRQRGRGESRHGFLQEPGNGEALPRGRIQSVLQKYGLTKDDLDEYGFNSQQRAIKATRAGAFSDEILPIPIVLSDGTSDTHVVDEGIRFDITIEGVRSVKLITEGGMLTAANSSQICDGASGMLVVNEAGLKQLGVAPLARIHHISVRGDDPVNMLEAPLPTTRRALQKAGMSIADIDLYEVNEAFASIPLAWLKVLDADPAKINVHGGAIALGHPLGASGTKLMTTLVNALRRQGKRWGLQTMCEGGGLANVAIVERL
jgi:acetyl-CoA C-acetyltransferase